MNADGLQAARPAVTDENAGVAPTGKRRDELLRATRAVIAESGFARATVEEITGKAGTSIGLLHYHFGSREQILTEAIAGIVRDELAEFQTPAHRNGAAGERLTAFLISQGPSSLPGSWRIWVDACAESMRNEALRVALDGWQRGYRAGLTEILADGNREGAWRCENPEDSAARLVAVLDGIGLHALLHSGDVSLAAATRWAQRLVSLELGLALADARVVERGQGRAKECELRVVIRARDLGPLGRMHEEALHGCLADSRDAWLRTWAPWAAACAEVTRSSIELRRRPVREDVELVVRCALDAAREDGIRTVEVISTASGEQIATAAATMVMVAGDGRARALTTDEQGELRA
jgi:AcrR family transcriptional regulator